MAKNIPVPYEIKDQIYHTLADFGCARWKALLTYAESLAKRSRFIPEEIRKEKAQQVAYKALRSLMSKEDGRITRVEYGDEEIIIPSGCADASFDALYSFEAFAALVKEVSEADQSPEFCYAGEAGIYPFHYTFTSGKQGNLYRVLVYGVDGFSRIGFLENTYKKDKRYITLLVVSDDFSWEDFTDVTIPGRYRIALITKGNKKNRTYRCQLTEIMEDE